MRILQSPLCHRASRPEGPVDPPSSSGQITIERSLPSAHNPTLNGTACHRDVPGVLRPMDASLSKAIAALTAPGPAVRCQAAEQLSRLGPDARSAAAALVQACGDESEEVREWAVAALEESGPPLASDAETLAGLLVADNADVGYWAATLLGRLGPDATPAVPALATAVCFAGCDAEQTLDRLTHPAPPQRAAVNPTPPPAPTANGDTIKIASFNIQVFGTSKLEKPQVMDVLARLPAGSTWWPSRKSGPRTRPFCRGLWNSSTPAAGSTTT